MYDELYTSISPEERRHLKTNRQNILTASLSSKIEYINHDALDWMAIYAPYFNRRSQIIKLSSSSYYYKTEDIDNYYPKNPDAEIRAPFNLNPRESVIHIHFVQTSTNAKIYEYADLLVNEGIFEKVNFANTLLVQHQKHKIQVLAKENLLLVLTNEFNNRLLNETAAIIPSLFKIEDLLQNERVMNCCRTVVNKQSIREFFIDEFEAIANAQKEAFTNNLKTLLTMNKRKNLEDITREIENTRHRINDYEQTLDTMQERLQSQLNLKLGIECTLNGDTTEEFKRLSDLLTKNKFIKEASFRRLNIGGGTKDLLSLEIESPITLYEIEPLERTYNNMIDYWSQTGQSMLKAIKEVFTNDKYQLMCTTHVSIDPTVAEFNSGNSALGYNLTNYTRMPQPHLTFYNCWGDSRSAIKQALRNDNIEDAIQLMLISVRNINFTDSTVFRGWLDRLCSESSLRYLECVVDTEGKWYSLTDIYNLVVEREHENEEVHQPELIDELGGIE